MTEQTGHHGCEPQYPQGDAIKNVVTVERGAAPGVGGVENARWRARLTIFAVVALGVFLFGWRMSQRGIWSAHEGRAAQNAARMLQTGEWLIPRLYTDDVDVQKPPLYYWTVASISAPRKYKVTPLTVRMPATVAAVIGLILVLRMGQKIWDLETGIFAAVILATTTRYAWLGRVGRIDMPLAVLCLAALYAFWRETTVAGPNGRFGRLATFYVCLAAAVLLKGPVALILILGPVGTYLLAVGEPIVPFFHRGARETWRRYHLGIGLAVVALIAGPWFAYAAWTTGGEFFWDFFVYHNLERALGTSSELKSGPVWFYIPRLLADCFPWSILLPAVATSVWKHRGQWRHPTNGAAPAYLFLLSWVGFQFLFLSLVSFKRTDYLLPVYPALALFLAGWLRDRSLRFERRIHSRPVGNPRRRARTVLVSAFLVAMVVAPLLVWASIEFRKKGIVKSIFKIDLVERYLNVTDRFMMDHVERILRDNWPLLGIMGLVIVGCVWVLHTGWYDRRNRRIIAALAVPWVVCFLFQIHLFLPAVDPLREMSRFGELIRTLATKDRTLYYFDKFDADLVFHAGRPARMVGDWDDLARLSHSPDRTFVVLRASQLEYVQRDTRMGRWFPVVDNRQTAFGEHREARVLVTNQPFALSELPNAGTTR